MTNGQYGRGPLTRQQMRVAAAGVVSLLTFAGLLTVPMPAQAGASGPPATVPRTTAASTTTSTTGPTTTTTVANQTAIISRSDSPPPPATAGEAGPAAPASPPAPAPEPPPPSGPGAAIVSLRPAPEAPPPPPTTPPPPPQVVLPRSAPAPRAPVLSSPRQVPAVLEAAAARRRELNARVLEAEAKVVGLEAEASSADAALGALRSKAQDLAARLEAARGRLRYQEQASLAPPPPVAAPAPAPQPKPTSPKGPVAAVWQKAVELGRAIILPDPPASAVIVADGVREREAALRRQGQLAASADALGRHLDELQPWAAAAEATVAAKAAELSEARKSLAEARNALSAAMADVAFGPQALGTALGSRSAEASRFALADIPADYLGLYQAAAGACPGLSWTVLAAVGSTESAHGRTAAPGVRDGANFAGAMGPMQFLAPTWAAYGLDAGGDGIADVYDPADAIHGAANYLCANGAGDPARLAGALWAYNHADWYVRGVLDLAIRYGAAGLHATSVDAASLLANPNLAIGPQAAADLAAGRVDRRVMEALAAIAAGHRITLGVIETGHAMHVKGTDRVSNHYYGRAVDIYEVDGAPVSAANDAAMELAVALLTAGSSIRPDELGSPWPELGRFPGAFTDAEHMDHLHLGWSANGATAPNHEEPQP